MSIACFQEKHAGVSIPPAVATAQPFRGSAFSGRRGGGPDIPAAAFSAQRGYTLIEVIVAFALLAFALTLLLGTLTGSTKQIRWSAEAGRAAIHAQSLLDRTGVGEALQPGRREGTFEGDDYRWTLDVTPYVDPTPSTQPTQAGIDPGAPKLMQLVLEVRWGEGDLHQRLDLRSLRLVAPDVNQPVAFP